MLQNKRHNPDKKGLNIRFDRILQTMRHPAMKLMTGLMFVTAIAKKTDFTTHFSEKINNSTQWITGKSDTGAQLGFSAAEAMDALLLANYGENYQPGIHKELDKIADTATTSAGLTQAVESLLSEAQGPHVLYAKRIRQDEGMANYLYQQAVEGFYSELAENKLGELQLHKPLPNTHKITSPYGRRRRPHGKASANHRGTDFGVKAGTEVYSVARSRLVKTGIDRNNNIGYVVMESVDETGRPNGFRFHYLHVRVADQQKINHIFEPGQVVTSIARQNEYGPETSTGPHLHFEIWQKNSRTGQYVVQNSTQIARNDFVLPGGSKTPHWENRLGQYVYQSLKDDVSGAGLAALETSIEMEYIAQKISKDEYDTRIKGLSVATEEVQKRAFGLFMIEQEHNERMAADVLRAFDQKRAPEPTYRQFRQDRGYEKPEAEVKLVQAPTRRLEEIQPAEAKAMTQKYASYIPVPAASSAIPAEDYASVYGVGMNYFVQNSSDIRKMIVTPYIAARNDVAHAPKHLAYFYNTVNEVLIPFLADGSSSGHISSRQRVLTKRPRII